MSEPELKVDRTEHLEWAVPAVKVIWDVYAVHPRQRESHEGTVEAEDFEEAWKLANERFADVNHVQARAMAPKIVADAEALTELAVAIASCPTALATLRRALGIDVIDEARVLPSDGKQYLRDVYGPAMPYDGAGLPEGTTVGTTFQFVGFSIGFGSEHLLLPDEADKLAELLREAATKCRAIIDAEKHENRSQQEESR